MIQIILVLIIQNHWHQRNFLCSIFNSHRIFTRWNFFIYRFYSYFSLYTIHKGERLTPAVFSVKHGIPVVEYLRRCGTRRQARQKAGPAISLRGFA